MKEIVLFSGQITIVDDDDFEELNKYKWTYSNSGYAERYNPIAWKEKGIHSKIPMHREINKTPTGMFTDHINGNKLDNRKCNLRTCNKSQNRTNSGLDPINKSGYKGVFWDKANKRWVARIWYSGKTVWSCYKRNILDAVKEYDLHAVKYFGEFAKTNKDIFGEIYES